jgi:hypothetical protein
MEAGVPDPKRDGAGPTDVDGPQRSSLATDFADRDADLNPDLRGVVGLTAR